MNVPLQLILYMVFCLAFWYGGRQVEDGEITFEEMMKARGCCASSAQLFMLGQTNLILGWGYPPPPPPPLGGSDGLPPLHCSSNRSRA